MALGVNTRRGRELSHCGFRLISRLYPKTHLSASLSGGFAMSFRVVRRVGAVSLLLVAAGLVWRVTAAQNAGEAKKDDPKVSEITTTLGGADRYLTHVS